MRLTLPMCLLLATAALPVSATAQVLTLQPQLTGEFADGDEDAFIEAIDAGVDRAVPGEAVSIADTAERIGDLAACSEPDCFVTIGETTPASVLVRAEVHGEADIYDFSVTVYAAESGAELVAQTGDCTFCPIAEAVDALGFTVQAAVSAIDPLPPSTRGEPEPEPVAEPVAEPTPIGRDGGEALGFIAGDTTLHLSAVPATAEIFVNGQRVGSGSVELEVGPQDLDVRFSAEGYDTREDNISIRAGMTGPIFFRVVMSTAAELAPAAVAASTTSPEARRRMQSIGSVLIGVGVAAIAGGATMLAFDGEPTCDSGGATLCADVWEFTAGGATLVGVGAATLGTGLGLVIPGLRNRDTAAVTPTWALGADRRSGSASLGLRF